MSMMLLIAAMLAEPAVAAAAPAETLPPRTRAQADLAQYLSDEDYPAEAREHGDQGTVGFELAVGPDGAVTGCTVTASSGSPALDRTSCEIIAARAHFTPARDAAGHVVPDRIAARINWALPPEPPPLRARARANLASYVQNGDYPPAALSNHEQGTVGFRLHVSPEGRVTVCDIMVSSGSRLLDLRTCQIMLVRARFRPARDAAGNPAEDVVSARLTWRSDW